MPTPQLLVQALRSQMVGPDRGRVLVPSADGEHLHCQQKRAVHGRGRGRETSGEDVDIFRLELGTDLHILLSFFSFVRLTPRRVLIELLQLHT